MTINKLEHKLLQMFIFIKRSANEISWSRNKFKYNTNRSKDLKKVRFGIKKKNLIQLWIIPLQ